VGGAFQEFANFAIGGLRKIVVPDADGLKRLGCLGANDLVDMFAKLGAGGRRSYRDSDNDALGLLRADGAGGGEHGGAGGQAIVYQNHVAMSDGEGRASLAIETFAALDFAALAPGNTLDESGRNPELFDEGIVQDADLPAGDGAHGEFFVSWDSELPDEENVEIGM